MTEIILDKGDFLSRFGMPKTMYYLNKKEYEDYSTISTDFESGALRALLLRVKKFNQNGYKIDLKYLFHEGQKNNPVVNILSLRCRDLGDRVKIESASCLGERYNFANSDDLSAMSKTFKAFANSTIRTNEWLNPVNLLEANGLISGQVGRKAWPGLYVTGEINNYSVNQLQNNVEPVFPALFFHSILGVGSDRLEKSGRISHSVTLQGQYEKYNSSVLRYSYQRDPKDPLTLDVRGTISAYGNDETKEETFYKIKTKPAGKGKNLGQISKLEFMGRPIDLTNRLAVSSVLKAIRNINRMIRAGDQELIDDLKRQPQDRRYALPTELALYTGIYDLLNETPKIPPKGIMNFMALGGNNIVAHTSTSDQHIGANQYIIEYTQKDETGEVRPESLMIDAGVLFHDVFDVTFYNASQYLKHKHDKNHQPQSPVQAILLTHKHKDHLGQVAYLVKCGYELPAMVMNAMTMRQLKRDMSELDIEASVKQEILSKCYSLNLLQDVNPQDPENRKITTIGDTIIEQWTEVLKGKDLGQCEYYPRLKIGSFEVRIGPMPHSDPGMMYDIITPAGSLRHTGDYKIDDTIRMGMPPLDVWLQGHRPDALSADSTGSTREGENPLERDVENAILSYLNDNEDKRFIFPMIGSNIARLTTLIGALGQSNRKTLIVDGKAVEDLVRDADKVFGFKEWAQRVHGIDVYLRSQKKTVEPYISDRTKDPEYAYLVSGSQDEPFSSINRAARDWLPQERFDINDNDLICFLQGIIPVGYNAYRRLSLQHFTEAFHKAKVLLPEIVAKETDLFLHSSGHNNREDMKKIISMSENPYVIPVHGGPDQLEEHATLAKESGADATVFYGTQRLQIEKPRKVKIRGSVPSELVGVMLHTPSKEAFYLKGRFSTAIMPIKPHTDNETLRLVDIFEQMARNESGTNSEFEMARVLPISLSKRFNAQEAGGFLKHNLPFGIDKYSPNVYEDKNIFAVAAFDTETGGLDPQQYLMREFGMTIEDLNGKNLQDIQLFQKIPDYRMPSVKALLVTNTDPYALNEGLLAHQFVDEMHQAIVGVKEHSYQIAQRERPDANLKRNQVKALVIAHNTNFDSQFIGNEKIRNLDTNTRPHQTRGLIALDTRIISRALAVYHPKNYNVNLNEDTGFADHTLEGLCEANNVEYDTSQSHGALYDTLPCMALYKKQREIAPDIVDQLIINADSSTGHLFNDMLGTATGFGGVHPVFTYVSPSATKPKPQMGSILGTMGSERYAVVFNLKYDPDDYLNLPTNKLIDLMKDPQSDVLEILDLRRQPIVLPARYGLRVNANANLPKETLDLRASSIRKHRNFVDPHHQWQSISQKISQAWQEQRDDLFKTRIIQDYPDTEKALRLNLKDMPQPEHGAIDLLKIRAKSGFNPVYQNIMKHVQLYLGAIRDDDRTTANQCYEEIMKQREHLSRAKDLINSVQFDLDRSLLLNEDANRIEAMRTCLHFLNHTQNMVELEDLKDPETYAQYIGEDTGKQKLLKTIENWVQDHEGSEVLDENAKRLIHPQRSVTRRDASSWPVNDDDPTPKPHCKIA